MIGRAFPSLAGLVAVALAVGWAESHPPRPILELSGASTSDRGPMPRGAFGRHSWTIRNAGIEPLQLRTRFTSGRSGFSLWLGADHVLEPGQQITVHLTWPIPEAGLQPFANYAALRTSDPTRTEIRLKVVGTSGPDPIFPWSRPGPRVAIPRGDSTIGKGFGHLPAHSVRSKGSEG